MDLGKVGIWWSGSWRVRSDSALNSAAEIESLGYGAIWSSGGWGLGLSEHFQHLVTATSRIPVASGIVNIWRVSPEEIAPAVVELEARHPERFLLGLGASHAPLVENYSRPYHQMVQYLDALDAIEPTVPKTRRVLAALGPRMLALAGTRTRGAHPYLVPVEHTAYARQMLGHGPLLAPEVTVVLEQDPTEARNLARTFISGYLTLPNYTNNLRSFGFGDDDLTGGGSDRLVDAVVAWGDVRRIASRVREHHEAGADHVCIQVVSRDDDFPLDQYQELAPALLTE
jgi:probable F420-dependent oxidoreductase